MVLWLSSLLAEQEVRGSILGLAAANSEIGYLLFPSRDMTERSLKRHKSSKQLTNLFGWDGNRDRVGTKQREQSSQQRRCCS